MPTPAAVRTAYRPSDGALLDRDGGVLALRRTDPHRRRLAWTPLDAVSPALRAAVVHAEDRRFRTHGGVDLRSLAAAAAARLAGGRRRGASTITMQLAALLEPGLAGGRGGRTLAQKWRQIRLARALERTWSKDEILEAYLNRVTFRGELEGVGAAAAVLFGKLPHGLDAAEATVLAALLQDPNAGRSTLARRTAALAPDGPSTAPAAVEAAIARALAPLPARAAGPNAAPHLAARLLREPGAAVRTTLDGDLQRATTALLRDALAELADRNVHDGAALVADSATGEVRAWVAASGPGSRAPLVDTVRARRQAGSTLKPFLFALALEERLVTPATLLADTPLEIAVAGGLYRPRDYDHRFRGLVSARTALAASLNVPAVRTLGLVGGEPFAAFLRAAGFRGLGESADFYGPALALGSADVTLLELVTAYRMLATGGVAGALRLRPDEPPTTPARVVSAATAFLVGDVLADRESRSTTFGLESPLATPFWTAVKTGTSKDMRDNWCIGWSDRYTVGVWVGNASGAPMHAVSGVTGAAPVWLALMRRLHRDEPSAPPAPPAGLETAEVAFAAGEPPRREWFHAGTAPRDPRPLAPASGTIVAPVAGTVVALDPDVPHQHQRVPLVADVADPAARFVLDGADIGPAASLLLWPPSPGRHELVLVDAGARPLDRATFVVRGGVRAPTGAPSVP